MKSKESRPKNPPSQKTDIYSAHPFSSSKQITKFPHTFSNNYFYQKFASSQNYYFTKDINSFISNQPTPNVILFQENLTLNDPQENLKRFYQHKEIPNRLEVLTEYYKFHIEVPRMFMLPVSETINKYHDKKRRINYIKVTKMIGLPLAEIIKINDSESEESVSQKSEDSYHPSLVSLLPSTLKVELNRFRKDKEAREKNRSGIDNTNASVTLRDLNGFLANVFKDEPNDDNDISNVQEISGIRQSKQHKIKLCPKIFEQLKLNFNRNFMKDSGMTSTLGGNNYQFKSLKPSNNKDPPKLIALFQKSPVKDSIFKNFKKNKNVQEENHGIEDSKKASKTKLDLREKLKDVWPRQGSRSQKFDFFEKGLSNLKMSIDRQFDNSGINNLNINIQMQTMNHKIPRPDNEQKRGIGVFNSCGKGKPGENKLEVPLFTPWGVPHLSIKVESPTFSLLNKFKDRNDKTDEQKNQNEDKDGKNTSRQISRNKKIKINKAVIKSLERTKVLKLPLSSDYFKENSKLQTLQQNPAFLKTIGEIRHVKNAQSSFYAQKQGERGSLQGGVLNKQSSRETDQEKKSVISTTMTGIQLKNKNSNGGDRHFIKEAGEARQFSQKFKSTRSITSKVNLNMCMSNQNAKESKQSKLEKQEFVIDKNLKDKGNFCANLPGLAGKKHHDILGLWKQFETQENNVFRSRKCDLAKKTHFETGKILEVQKIKIRQKMGGLINGKQKSEQKRQNSNNVFHNVLEDVLKRQKSNQEKSKGKDFEKRKITDFMQKPVKAK